MTDKEEKAIYLMQAVCLANYCKLCIQLNQIPELSVVQMINNCEDTKKLIETNKIILSELK